MTGQSLFYMGETNLQHKILAIVEEEGASRASYALKLLQSEGELTIASTGKDANSGNLITQEYRVSGPVMIFLTTTAIEIDEELMNRCIVLTVDEGRAQTEAIHSLQRRRRTLTGLMAKQGKEAVLALHRNAQRLLRPIAVVNPYADQLTFLSDKTRTRRDHEKYLTLIDTIALLHQHQRTIRTARDGDGAALEYIEVTLEDIEQANRLTHEVLGRSLDELPPQTRRLLTLVAGMVAECGAALELARRDIRFSRKDVREQTGWGDTQLKIHLGRLAELEYLLVHRAERGQGYVYELLYDGDGSTGAHLIGLLDAGALGAYDKRRSGQERAQSASGRPSVGGWSAGGRGASFAAKPVPARVAVDDALFEPENAHPAANGHAPVVAVLAGSFALAAHRRDQHEWKRQQAAEADHADPGRLELEAVRAKAVGHCRIRKSFGKFLVFLGAERRGAQPFLPVRGRVFPVRRGGDRRGHGLPDALVGQFGRGRRRRAAR